MDFWIAVAPILFLIVVMTKRRSWPSHIALPATALLVLVLRVFYFAGESWLTSAALIKGALSALTPIAIIWSAILLADFMQRSGAQSVVNQSLDRVSRHPVAQLMLIGWAFTFMLEGASGFGTPAAIAAPILVALGFPPLRIAMLTLVMNSVPVSFGAVGTPTWFGFEPLSLSEEALLEIGVQSAWIHMVASLIIPAMALSLVLSGKEIRQNLVFILFSSLSCSLPYLGLANLNYEFPSLIGGAVGMALTALLAKLHIGLSAQEETPESSARAKGATISPDWENRPTWIAFLPYLLLIAVLVLTRLPGLGLRSLLTSDSPALRLPVGPLGEFELSAALVAKWNSILGTATDWSFPALFVPAFIPFLLVVLLVLPVFSSPSTVLRKSLATATKRLRLPSITLVGALIMVELMMESSGEKGAMTLIIGTSMADLTGTSWQYFASLMGALGSFFSGSASVSNLTFGGIQQAIAMETGLDPTLILALQSVGASMGNMICINNIVAVCTILGLANQEGTILKLTILPMIAYALIAAGMSVLLVNL
ncbi:MAG: L-lactate permease [Verrucomicrobiota bacterium]